MGDWDEFNSTFWMGIATLTFSFFGLALKSCLRSKCDDVSLCGIVHIHRRVELEHSDEEPEQKSNKI